MSHLEKHEKLMKDYMIQLQMLHLMFEDVIAKNNLVKQTVEEIASFRDIAERIINNKFESGV